MSGNRDPDSPDKDRQADDAGKKFDPGLPASRPDDMVTPGGLEPTAAKVPGEPQDLLPTIGLTNLDHSPSDPERAIDPSSGTGGTQIGLYRLLRLLGRGGMGEIWMAEQSEPVRRRVALKLIKSDVSSREILARFEAERQALALMNHPNIARILDLGTSDDGQPFYVMELVAGTPLSRYCDDNRLGSNSGWTCSCRSAPASSTRTRRGSSTATSSPATSWSAWSTASRSPRSSTLGWPRHWRARNG